MRTTDDAGQSPLSAEASEAMLQFMRSPDELVESVQESVSLENRAIRATTVIRFTSTASDTRLAYRYIDIAHPDKGLAVHVSLETEGAELASHREHSAIASDAIGYRFSSIVDKLTLVTQGAADMEALQTHFGKVRADLEAIPSLSQSKALENLNKHFDKTGDPLWLGSALRVNGIRQLYYADDGSMRALYRLCKRLARKYLLLVRVPTSGEASQHICFTVERSYSTESPKGRSKAGLRKSDSGTKKRGSKPKGMLRRHAFFGATPTTFRYHVPWAKKTSHYSFTAQAPYGQFFSRAEVVTRETEEPNDETNIVLDSSAAVPFSWATSIDQGDRVNFFVGKGRSWTQPLYISLTHRELPGRSLLRVLSLTTIALILFLAFFSLAVFFDVKAGDASAAVLALLALGGIASPWPRDSGPMGIPLLSRLIPVIVAAITSCFLVWLLTHRDTYGWFGFPGGLAWGIACILGAVTVLVRLLFRLHYQTYEYQKAMNSRPITGGTFH